MDLQAERSYPTPYANSSLLPLLLLSLARQKHTPDFSTQFSGEYDYIIVGAGSAGSVVASRLSELSWVNVLLVEAGKPPPLLTEIPVIAPSFFNTDIGWGYRTTPQKFTAEGLIDRRVPYPSGKTIGGTGIFNGGVYLRGNRKNYDDWADQGAVGWSYEEVLPYFKKLEDNQDPEFLENGYHGKRGPVTTEKPRYEGEIKQPLVQAAYEMGYRFVDSNGPTQTGFYDFQTDTRDGQRCSTAKAYLVPAENRTNLDILPNAMVKKVIIEHNRAIGVHIDYYGQTYEIRARKEVILSAGTVNTAQLLMLSGIGPRRELEKFNIPIVADLPVGRNLQDHISTLLPFELNNDIEPFPSKYNNEESIRSYINNRTGPLASAEGCSLIALMDNDESTPDVDFPDHQLYFFEGAALGIELFGLRPDVYDQVFRPYEGIPTLYCFVGSLHPRSRGTVKLQTDDPYDSPLIDPNYFEHPLDLVDHIEGMKTCLRFGASRPMQSLGCKLLRTLYPGCEDLVENTEQFLRCIARSLVLTTSHPVGTAKMGDPMDPTTVVDPELRVKGVSGLRVVDGSVVPIIPSGNVNIPIIMIAEKASNIIKESLLCEET